MAGSGSRLASLARVLWLPGLVFALHLFLSSGPDYYTTYELTDELMHPLGGFAIAFAVARALAELRAHAITPDPGPLLRRVLVFSLTATAAVLWEFAEYLSDRWFGTRTLGDLEDTLLDMALGLAGCCCYLLLELLAAPAATREPRPSRGLRE